MMRLSTNSLIALGLFCSSIVSVLWTQPVIAFNLPETQDSQLHSRVVHIQVKAQMGEPEAQYLLGLMYLSGRFVERDPTQGFFMLEKAAHQQHFKAQQTLADLSFEGKIVPRNLLKAEKWYLSMAEKNDGWAHFRLGFIYAAGGDGVERHCGKALTQFTAAGDDVALGNVAWILATCPEAEFRDGTKAVSLSLKLLESNENDPTILDNLAAGYAEMGDFSQAVEVQKQAIDALKNTPEVAKTDEFKMRLQRYENKQTYQEIIPLLD